MNNSGKRSHTEHGSSCLAFPLVSGKPKTLHKVNQGKLVKRDWESYHPNKPPAFTCLKTNADLGETTIPLEMDRIGPDSENLFLEMELLMGPEKGETTTKQGPEF